MKTLRLIFPQWQGGLNPKYVLGASVLAHIAPQSHDGETIEVPVDKDFSVPLIKENGFYAGKILARQQLKAKEILREKQAEKVITFGGDCSVSQAPFDYLHEIYPHDLGIVWIDAHPDISTPKDVPNEHAMVLGNLLGDGAAELSAIVEHPFKYEDIIYAGLIAGKLLPYEIDYINKHKLPYLTPAELEKDSGKLLSWIKNKGFSKTAVHFDVDVLTSDDFRSVLYHEPGLGAVDYATGSMKLAHIMRIIKDIETVSEIVGLTFAEYMPWDLIHLKAAMEELDIFK